MGFVWWREAEACHGCSLLFESPAVGRKTSHLNLAGKFLCDEAYYEITLETDSGAKLCGLNYAPNDRGTYIIIFSRHAKDFLIDARSKSSQERSPLLGSLASS